MFEFKYTVSEKDYLEFNKFHIKTSKANRTIRIFLYFVFFIIITKQQFVYLIKNGFLKEKSVSFWIANIIVYIMLLALVFFLIKLLDIIILKIYIKLMKRDGKLPFDENIVLRFDEDSFTEITQNTESKASYSRIERVEKSKSAIYIYISQIQASIIPNHVFKSPKEIDDLILFINQKTSEYKSAN